MTLLLSLMLGLQAGVTSPRVTAERVERQIASQGPQQTLRSLYDNVAVWHEVLRQIATGREPWLKNAVALIAASDAGASEQIRFAVGEALERRPASVLLIAGSSAPIEVVCGGPDVDDARYDSLRQAMQAIERRQKRVAAVSDAALHALRDRCIASLEASKSGIERFYGPN